MAKTTPTSEFDSKFVNQKRNNTKSDLIEITEDKLENILLKHLHKKQKAQSWLTPLTLFMTVLIVLLTSDFKDFIGIKKEVWNALFLLTLFVSFIWLIAGVVRAVKHTKSATLEYLISQIKNNE